jgi:hypothetical protein
VDSLGAPFPLERRSAALDENLSWEVSSAPGRIRLLHRVTLVGSFEVTSAAVTLLPFPRQRVQRSLTDFIPSLPAKPRSF